MEIFKPKAILIAAKAGYEITSQRSVAYLNQLFDRLKDALQTLEKRKVLIDDPQSVNILVADNSDLIEFAKKIELESYEKTNDEAYLDNFINLHESGLYNRIRDNLSREKAIQFANLPKNVSEEEQKLKSAIPAALSADKPNNLLMNDYLAAVKKWEDFLNRIRTQYPSYFAMRYGSIFKPLPELQSSIPPATTLVRYFFVDSSLFALVMDSTRKKLVRLQADNLESDVTSLVQYKLPENEQVGLLNSLYGKLWKPFEQDIHSPKLMIVPDGILFNLSFEMLPMQPATSFSSLNTSSLLSKYSIAYHYSLFMLKRKNSNSQQQQDYVAFVPGFSDDLKKEYSSSVKDSVNLDFQYLSLLPQPSTSRLAKKVKGLLDGDAFLNHASTERTFIENASGHKIIHIGTHAEFNNTHPERSRLIFAKDMSSPGETNSLYLSDVYNCNISSDLTILTACESGKPGFIDGEGMISLAHAFNYAGSESILTGLWKLDEQSSNRITDLFIQNLIRKLPTDEALRQAKLQYLETAEGRMRAPAYWAGMVLLGEPNVIPLTPSSRSTLWLIFAGLAIAAIGGWSVRKKLRQRRA
jgi:CHAT domain-containing protein